VNSLKAVAGIKKLNSLYPFLHSKITLSNSESIHLSEALGLPDFTIGNPERNLETFQSLLRNFFVD
jgi:hypothetical protein